jgi:hypothetical protein
MGFTGTFVKTMLNKGWSPRIEPDCGITFVVGFNPNPFGHAFNLNPFGHALFRMGHRFGFLHVDEPHAYPKFIAANELRHYLRDEGKHITHEQTIRLPNPNGALAAIRRLGRKKWWWLVIPHNCVSFCEAILHAGGSHWTSLTNLPLLDRAINQFGAAVANAERDVEHAVGNAEKDVEKAARKVGRDVGRFFHKLFG